MDNIRVLIADDHTLFRDGLKSLLQSVPDIEVVAETSTGQEAVSAVQEQTTDVVLMDIQMPDMNGVEATRRIVQQNADVGVIMLTMFDDDPSVIAAMRAGARAYVLKGADQEAMLRAIRSVAKGESLFSPEISRRLNGLIAGARPRTPRVEFSELTERELEILARIAGGETNEEIARTLVISLKTVRNHVSNILNKLGVADRTQAAILAKEAGLASSPVDKDSPNLPPWTDR